VFSNTDEKENCTHTYSSINGSNKFQSKPVMKADLQSTVPRDAPVTCRHYGNQ